MPDEDSYTLEEAESAFAKKLNGRVWQLLETPDRSSQDDELMVHAAHASCYHWLQVGTALHHQRAEWLISKVYSTLGRADSALRHAELCRELTRESSDLMEDFDVAYSHECLARANGSAGNLDEARNQLRLADEAGQAIANEEDRRIFLDDLQAGDWFGLK